MQAAVFLGFAPNVTNGYFVMRGDGNIELTSNITEEPLIDEPIPVLKDNQLPRNSSRGQAQVQQEEKSPEERMMDVVMVLKEEKDGISVFMIEQKFGILLPWMIHLHH